MENFCVNCDRKLDPLSDAYPLWNKTEARMCSKCQSKANFFLNKVESQKSALYFYKMSKPKLTANGLWPHGLSYIENYCRFLDDAKPAGDNIQTEENPEDIIIDFPPTENKVANILSVIALVIFIVGFAVGFVMLFNDFWLALSYWAGTFITGMFFIGFAEIIKLLQKISDK